MKVFYMTFGCKVNQYETECIRERFEAEGFQTVQSLLEAEIAVVNTCTVTSAADSKCRQFIRKIKKENPACIICAAGCMTQTLDNDSTLAECSVIVGSRNKTLLPYYIKAFLENGERVFNISDSQSHEIEPMFLGGTASKTRAYIKIQDGCEMYCTYCAIPHARGKLSSKPIDDIVKEATSLISSGHKELILTGINLCCYGRELRGSTRLIDALEAVCSLEGEYRVRLSSIEPEMLTDSDLERMASLERLCPHFHLSLQSGCDSVLKRMKRHYDTGMYYELVTKLKKRFKDCAITTDIMVGFPGESEEEHKASISFAKKAAFADAHIFPFSRRKNTPADKMPLQLDNKTKHRRALEMAAAIKELRNDFLEGMVGKTVRVLFEKESSPLFHQGHSDNYTLVKIDRISESVTLRRQLLLVKITSHDESCCYGELVKI